MRFTLCFIKQTKQQRFIALKSSMSIHITPTNDLKEHDESSTCGCSPKLIIENGEMIFVHNSYDNREIIEEVNQILNK